MKTLYIFFVLIILFSGCVNSPISGYLNNPKNRVLVVIRGDSFCAGIGSTGTTDSKSYYGGVQVQGDSTLGKLISIRLKENISNKIFVVDIDGYPGQTAEWFLKQGDKNTHFEDMKLLLINKSAQFETVIFSSPYGTNEEGLVGSNIGLSVDSLVKNISDISRIVRSIPEVKGKIKILGYPVTNRIDQYSNSSSNEFRNIYNEKILKDPSITGSDVIGDFKNFQVIYSDNAPKTSFFNQSDVDGLHGVHPSNSGYNALAEMYAQRISDLAGAQLPPLSKSQIL